MGNALCLNKEPDAAWKFSPPAQDFYTPVFRVPNEGTIHMVKDTGSFSTDAEQGDIAFFHHDACSVVMSRKLRLSPKLYCRLGRKNKLNQKQIVFIKHTKK